MRQKRIIIDYIYTINIKNVITLKKSYNMEQTKGNSDKRRNFRPNFPHNGMARLYKLTKGIRLYII